jgi:hypothetical protein
MKWRLPYPGYFDQQPKCCSLDEREEWKQFKKRRWGRFLRPASSRLVEAEDIESIYFHRNP